MHWRRRTRTVWRCRASSTCIGRKSSSGGGGGAEAIRPPALRRAQPPRPVCPDRVGAGAADCRFWASWARSFLIECLFLTAQLHHAPPQDAERPVLDPDHPATAVVQFLQTRYGERITLARLAREFHTNRTTLHSSSVRSPARVSGPFCASSVSRSRARSSPRRRCRRPRSPSVRASPIGSRSRAPFARRTGSGRRATVALVRRRRSLPSRVRAEASRRFIRSPRHASPSCPTPDPQGRQSTMNSLAPVLVRDR